MSEKSIKMSEKSIKRNYLYNTVYSIMIVVAPLITAPYLSRVLGADGIGLFSFAASISSYFLLFSDMGAARYGGREVSYYQDDIEKRSIVFWEIALLRVINTLIALSVYFVLVFFSPEKYRTIFLVISLQIVNTACDPGWLLAGLEEFGKLVFRSVVMRVLDIAFVFIFIKTKSDLPLYIFGFVFFTVMGSIVMWTYVPYYVNKPDFKSLRPFRNIKTVVSLFLPTIAANLYTALDKTMIGIFTEGTFENGYYEQALKISRTVIPLITSLAGVMLPRIGYLFRKNDSRQIISYMYVSYKFVWFLGIPLCLGLISISDNFVPWFFGPGYEKVAGLLKISSFVILAISMSSTTGIQYLVPTKRQHIFTLSVAAGAATNFMLNLILIRMYQSYGAIAASVMAEIAVASVQFYAVRKELSIKQIIISGANYFIAGGVMLALLLFMSARLTPSFIHTFTMIFTGAAIYFSLLFILRDKFFLEYSARPFAFVRRKILRRKENNN